jgi:murein tripeptide amidase MpaA
MALLHVEITGRDPRHLTGLMLKHRVIVVGHREIPRTAEVVVDAYVPPNKVGWLEKRGYRVAVIENVEPASRRRQREGHRAEKSRLQHGRYGDVVWGGGYLTADEIEKAMVIGETNHGACLERIPLPHLTWEGRRCHALRIGKGRGKRRVGICLIGGIHGREWGSPDILVYLAIRLLRAYRDRQGLRLGKKNFTAAELRRLVESKDIILFPQVNPDGRHFSMNDHPWWRKNRRPAPRGRGPKSIGVDLNRNFPLLWRFDRHFAPRTVDCSHKPGHYECYVGPRAASEPETRNVIWLLDRFPQIRYFVDLHSYGETLLYPWGTDQNQPHDPSMSFLNTVYDGKRGRIHDDEYREFMPAADERRARELGLAFADAVRRVRGRKYRVQQGIGLYPTCGTTNDYAYSRHFVDGKKTKIIAYTLEWGRSRASTPFHPPYPEMRKVMREITAGLLEFCLRADGGT